MILPISYGLKRLQREWRFNPVSCGIGTICIFIQRWGTIVVVETRDAYGRYPGRSARGPLNPRRHASSKPGHPCHLARTYTGELSWTAGGGGQGAEGHGLHWSRRLLSCWVTHVLTSAAHGTCRTQLPIEYTCHSSHCYLVPATESDVEYQGRRTWLPVWGIPSAKYCVIVIVMAAWYIFLGVILDYPS